MLFVVEVAGFFAVGVVLALTPFFSPLTAVATAPVVAAAATAPTTAAAATIFSFSDSDSFSLTSPDDSFITVGSNILVAGAISINFSSRLVLSF